MPKSSPTSRFAVIFFILAIVAMPFSANAQTATSAEGLMQSTTTNSTSGIFNEPYLPTTATAPTSQDLVTITGILNESVYDDFENNKSSEQFFVRTNDGSINITLPRELSGNYVGQNVQIIGYKNAAGDVTAVTIFPTPNEPPADPNHPGKNLEADAPGFNLGKSREFYQSVQVIRVYDYLNSTDPGNPPEKIQKINDIFFDTNATSSVTSYYSRNSSGHIRLHGNVYPRALPVQVPDFRSQADLAEFVESAAKWTLKDIDYTKYYSYVFILENYAVCNGRSSVGPGTYLINNKSLNFTATLIPDGCLTPKPSSGQIPNYLFLHEMGHTLGLRHASAWEDFCEPDKVVPVESLFDPKNVECNYTYLDGSVMGIGNNDLSGYQRRMIGGDVEVNTAHIFGQYTIWPFETSSPMNIFFPPLKNQYQEIDIPVVDGFYTLEYRPERKGVVIRLFKNDTTVQWPFNDTFLQVYNNINDPYAVWPQGNTFFDPLRRISIKIQSTTPDLAIVEVTP